MLHLPPELLLHILSFLHIEERCRLGYVCKQLHTASQDPSMWRTVHIASEHDTNCGNLHMDDLNKLVRVLRDKKPGIEKVNLGRGTQLCESFHGIVAQLAPKDRLQDSIWAFSITMRRQSIYHRYDLLHWTSLTVTTGDLKCIPTSPCSILFHRPCQVC